jgi:hypothetical protein
VSGAEGTALGPHPVHGQVVYLQLPAADVTASAAFYEAVFGWSVDGVAARAAELGATVVLPPLRNPPEGEGNGPGHRGDFLTQLPG